MLPDPQPCIALLCVQNAFYVVVDNYMQNLEQQLTAPTQPAKTATAVLGSGDCQPTCYQHLGGLASTRIQPEVHSSVNHMSLTTNSSSSQFNSA